MDGEDLSLAWDVHKAWPEAEFKVNDGKWELSKIWFSLEPIPMYMSVYTEIASDINEKERVANEKVEGLMMHIVAAKEEIIRWKVMAQPKVWNKSM
ncbi:myosin heavy chain, non-muscle isoform X1 [Tanacetum coccineum]